MKLNRINYRSAVFFGVMALIMYLLVGIFEVILVSRVPAFATALGNQINPLAVIVYAPLLGAIVAYISAVVVICTYNTVARKFPISWVVKK